MQTFIADVRFTFRQLRRAPALYATIIGLIVAGVGATTATVSVAYALFLRPLPHPDADALSVVRTTARWANPKRGAPLTVPDFLDFKAQSTTLLHLSAMQGESIGLTSDNGAPERVAGVRVSGDFFELLGARPRVGRLLTPADDRPGRPCVAVVSSALWQRRFGGDPALVGRAVGVNGVLCSVVGVAPEGFAFGDISSIPRADVWTPLAAMLPEYARISSTDRSFEAFWHILQVIGRRKPGVSLEQAGSDLRAVAQRLATQYPPTNEGKGVVVTDLREHLVGHARSATWLLFASVGLVFLIVCANVANLLLARSEARRGEMAVRVALGATRGRLVAQVLTECVVLLALGSAGGVLLAKLLVAVVASTLVDPRLASTLDIGLDGLTLAVSIVACVTCGLAFALVPALAASRLAPQTILRESAAGSGRSRARRRTQQALVGAQVALAFVLLVAGGLTGQGLRKLLATPLGFDPEQLATGTVSLPEARYPGGGSPDWPAVPAVTAFYRDAVDRLAAAPGVEAAAANGCLPIACGGWSVAVEGRPPALHNQVGVLGFHVVTCDYFKVTKIPLLRGRTFTAADRADTRLVVILSEAAAEQLFPGEDPIGRRIDSGVDEPMVWREVVGVVGNVRSGGVTQPVGIDGYFPLEQLGAWNRSMTLLARSERAESLLREIPAMVRSLDPQQDVTDVMTMSDRVSTSVGKQRRLAVILTVFALFAQVLAALGFFGLMSYSTAQRTREFGIRLALGSTPGAIVLLVVKGGLVLLGVGLAAGSVGALLLGRVLAGKLPEVRAFDLTLFAVVPALLALVGLLGCWLPARRAARIAPARALRYD